MTPHLELFCHTHGDYLWSKIYMFCIKHQIKKVSDFNKLTEVDILKDRGMGKKTLIKLREQLFVCGIVMLEV